MFLGGCLWWLEGDQKRATQAFEKALERGRGSFLNTIGYTY